VKLGLKQVGDHIFIVNIDTGEPVENAAAWIWGKGSSLNGKFVDEVPDEVIRSWPEADGAGDLLFDQQLYGRKDYILVAVPCDHMQRELIDAD